MYNKIIKARRHGIKRKHLEQQTQESHCPCIQKTYPQKRYCNHRINRMRLSYSTSVATEVEQNTRHHEVIGRQKATCFSVFAKFKVNISSKRITTHTRAGKLRNKTQTVKTRKKPNEKIDNGIPLSQYDASLSGSRSRRFFIFLSFFFRRSERELPLLSLAFPRRRSRR